MARKVQTAVDEKEHEVRAQCDPKTFRLAPSCVDIEKNFSFVIVEGKRKYVGSVLIFPVCAVETPCKRIAAHHERELVRTTQNLSRDFIVGYSRQGEIRDPTYFYNRIFPFTAHCFAFVILQEGRQGSVREQKNRY